MARVLLALLLWGGPCFAEDADTPRRSYVVPALEAELFHFGFLAFSNLVSEKEFARVSWDSISAHFDGRAPWAFDEDTYLTNHFGHAYQGALTFSAARSSGLNFWWSTLYAGIASTVWELFFEVDNPSINDELMTTLGGAFLGEAMHRMAQALIVDGNEPMWVRYLGAFIIDPMGVFNRWLYAEDLDPMGQAHTHSFVALSTGFRLPSRVYEPATGATPVTNGTQFALQLLFTYVMPGDSRPFAYFNLDTSAIFSALPLTTLFVRGLLWGSPFHNGVWGIFGTYDFAQPAIMRVSSVGLGPGTQLAWNFTEHAALQVSGVLSTVPYAAVGALGLNEDLYRNYHIGPGLSGVLDLRLIHSQAGMLRVLAQQWLVVGAYGPPSGFESMTYLTVSAWVKLGWHIAASIDVAGAWRAPYFSDDQYGRNARSTSVTVSLAYMSNETFGAKVR